MSQQPLHLSLFAYAVSVVSRQTAVQLNTCFNKSNYCANTSQQCDKFQYFYLTRTIIPLSLMKGRLLRFQQDN